MTIERRRRTSGRLVGLLAAIAFVVPHDVSAFDLITSDEARRPAAEMSSRGGGAITRGPTVTLISPLDERRAGVPFRFAFSVKTHGTTALDVDNLTVVYLRKPLVDLTDRVRPFLKDDLVAIPDAVVPSGTHTILVTARDSQGSSSRTFFDIRVKP